MTQGIREPSPADSPSTEERLRKLEVRVDELSQSVERLGGARETPALPAEPERAATTAEDPSESLTQILPGQGAVLRVLTQVGRSSLVLGGAFLVRGITEAGTLPGEAGVALGLAYAVLWIWLARRSARSGNGTSAAFLGVTSVVIAYSLVIETATRFRLLTPGVAAAALLVLTGVSLAAAWLESIPALAWAASLAALLASAVISILTRAIAPFAAALVILGIAAFAAAELTRRWHALAWLFAVAADVFVVSCTAAAVADASLGARPPRSVGPIELSALALPVLYLASFAFATLASGHPVGAFELLQGIASTGIGITASLAIASAAGDGQSGIGNVWLVAAAAAYALAFVCAVRRRPRLDCSFFAAAGLVWTLSASALLLRGAPLTFLWCGAALAAAVLSRRAAEASLEPHAAAFAIGAAWQSGLMTAAGAALTRAPGSAWPSFTVPAFAALLAAATSYLLVTRDGGEKESWPGRFARLLLLVIVVVGVGGILVGGAAPSVRELSGSSASAGLAALRTGVLAFAALVLAGARRKSGLPETGWLAYALLFAGGGKLLLEDLPNGVPATLFAGFALYGLALLAAPRLLRARPSATGSTATG